MTMTSLAPVKRRTKRYGLLPKISAKRALDLVLTVMILLAIWPVLLRASSVAA